MKTTQSLIAVADWTTSEDMKNISDIMKGQDYCRFHFMVSQLLGKEADGLNKIDDHSENNCPPYYDKVLCWQETAPDTFQTLPCPSKYLDIQYTTIFNVSRYCMPNGTWAPEANYSGCVPFTKLDTDIPLAHLTAMYAIYWIGYMASLLFLLIALAIFLHYKSLWCLRNIIHTNLILSFALHNVTWILYSIIGLGIISAEKEMTLCIIPSTMLKYFVTCGFFWMFIEGFFLFVTVLFSFHARKIRYWMCAIFGWGIPFILLMANSLMKANQPTEISCSVDQQYHLDYIFIGPVLVLLLLNLFFLLMIMYVIVTKLKLTVRAEAERYKRAIKALFILCPLLGVIYLLVLVMPTRPLWLRLIFQYYITIMTSSQGLLIALFFCFRNNEVMNCIRVSYKHVVDQWSLRRRSTQTISFSFNLPALTALLHDNYSQHDLIQSNCV